MRREFMTKTRQESCLEYLLQGVTLVLTMKEEQGLVERTVRIFECRFSVMFLRYSPHHPQAQC